MTQPIQAIYEQGVFRPLELIELAEHAQVSIIVPHGGGESSTDEAEPSDVLKRQQAALKQLRAEMDALPLRAPDDGLGGADHDLILYGWQK